MSYYEEKYDGFEEECTIGERTVTVNKYGTLDGTDRRICIASYDIPISEISDERLQELLE